jgi:hypothetical protein
MLADLARADREPALAYWEMVAPLVLSGTGIAFAVPAIQTAVVGAVRPEP